MLTIGTHDGRFHCDEVMACGMLLLIEKYRNSTIIRSRDLQVLAGCDVLVDVGGKFHPESCRFDHHQRDFQETFATNESIPLSSAGLIYKFFGKSLLKNRFASLSDSQLHWVFCKIYQCFIKVIDAIDNGIDPYSSQDRPHYIDFTNLSYNISIMNAPWNAKEHHGDRAFHKAIKVAQEQFLLFADHVANVLLPAKAWIELAFENSLLELKNQHKVLQLNQHLPWEELYQDFDNFSTVSYVMWPNDSPDSWCLQSPRQHPATFACRNLFPEAWRGLSGSDLARQSGIENAVFCHRSGFFAVVKNQDSALEFLETSLNYQTK